jgi:hypothetical protein
MAVLVREQTSSTARRQYAGASFCRIAWKNNVFPRAKLARYVRCAALVLPVSSKPANTIRSENVDLVS